MRSPAGAVLAIAIVAGSMLVVATPATAAPDYGALTPAGCIADVGDAAGCGTTQQGLNGATSVAASPDGKSVYVASGTDDSVVRFDRNTTTGALTPAGCIADVGDTAGCGTTQQGLNGAYAVTVSPDSKSVYVAGQGDHALVRFDRNTATGALTPAGCIADVGSAIGCGTTQQGLFGANSVTVSPDGRSVYVSGSFEGAVVRFDRNTTTGALTPAGCFSDVGDPAGCGTTQQGLGGAFSVAVSPDSKSVYVAGNSDDAVVRFDRNTTTGALTPAGCISDVGDPAGCGTTQQGLDNTISVAASPDSKSVYVAGFNDDAIVRLDRNTTTGALTPAGCISDVGDPAGCGTTQQGLDGAYSVAVSPDGRSAYATAFFDDALVRFDRGTTTGALTPGGCISDVGAPAACGTTQQGLNGAVSVAASPDGRSIYAAGYDDDAVVRFDRVPDASNHSPIRIPGTGTAGNADPFPSTVVVSGLESKIADVNVTLHGLGHSFPADLEMLLQGPGGQRVLLMSDAGGVNPVGGLEVTFDDSAPGRLPSSGTLTSGSYRPTNFNNFDFDPFAPPGYCNPGPDEASPQTSCLTSAFVGTNPNGTWSLSIYDGGTGDAGELTRGWSLDITTDVVAPETTISPESPSGTFPTGNPSFAFSANEPATFECSLDFGAFTPCSSPKAYTALPDGPHAFAVRATDAALNVDPTPATRTFTVDTTAPETTISPSSPSGTISNPNPSFAFSANEPATFECRLDNATFTDCSSPQAFTALPDGPHTFAVRAIDAGLNADPTPATRGFTVDTAAPETTISPSSPSGTISNPNPSFAFSANEAATFDCALDGAAFTPCTSPRAYAALADGPHTFAVRAADAALNLDPTPATRTFTVDTTTPETTISPSSPAGTIPDPNPSFAFSANEAATFQCSLDNAAFTTCSSPKAYTALPDGPHTFAVRATDAALNVDPTPATRSFNVDTSTPVTATPDTQLNGTATAAKKQKQKGKKILLTVQIDAQEPLTASATGTIKLGKTSFTVTPLTQALGSGKTTLTLKPTGKDAKKIAKALADGKKAKATITVTLTDAAGNKTTRVLVVKLAR